MPFGGIVKTGTLCRKAVNAIASIQNVQVKSCIEGCAKEDMIHKVELCSGFADEGTEVKVSLYPD